MSDDVMCTEEKLMKEWNHSEEEIRKVWGESNVIYSKWYAFRECDAKTRSATVFCTATASRTVLYRTVAPMV